MHQVFYNKKLEYKCTLTTLDPRPIYIGPIQAKGHLSIKDTCTMFYSCLSVLCELFLAVCNAAG